MRKKNQKTRKGFLYNILAERSSIHTECNQYSNKQIKQIQRFYKWDNIGDRK
jgi:hypothetical protein